MKIYKIYNRVLDEITYIRDKTRWCKTNGVCVRSLNMTFEGKRNHTKNYVLLNRINVTPTEQYDNQEKIWVQDMNKYCYVITKEGNDEFSYKKKDVKKSINSISDIDTSVLEKELKNATKKIQKLTDKLRIQRKINRQDFRADSIVEDFQREVITQIKESYSGQLVYMKPFDCDKTEKLVVQLSDLHIGKVVDLPNNKFNYEVVEERLETYANKVLNIVERNNIGEIYLVITGDLFNLDSHFDALLTNQDNRATSFVKGLDILSKFIRTLASHINKVRIYGVLGNESRLRTTEYNANVDSIANNNLDTLLFSILERLLKDYNVVFENQCDTLNCVVNIGEYTLALSHGDKFKHTESEISKFKIKLLEQYGTYIDYLIFGHIHSCKITSNYGRSGSIVGNDEYYTNGLNGISGIPSQNIYYITENGIEGREIKL